MADNKKTDAASDDTDRLVDETEVDSQTPEDDAAQTDEAEADAAAPEEDAEAIEDAEVISEIAAETDPSEETAEAVEETATIDLDDMSGAEDAATDALEGVPDEPDPEVPDAEDIADLETLDGVEDAVAAEAAEEDVAEGSAEDPITSDTSSDSGTAPESSLLSAVAAGPEPLRTVEKETVVVERRGGLVAGFLGGILATLGLAFAAPFVIPENMMPDFGTRSLKTDLAVQTEKVSTLESEVTTLRTGLTEAAKSADLTTLQSQTSDTTGSLQTAVDDLKSTLTTVQADAAPAADLEAAQETLKSLTDERDALLTRIDALEKRPIAEATDPASVAAVQAYGRELASLRTEVNDVMSQAQDMVSKAAAAAEEASAKAAAAAEEAVKVATSKSQAAIEAAEAREQAAAEKAAKAARADALVDIQAALEAGEPYHDALARLDGVEIPPDLAEHAADGVPTLAELQEAFPPAARAALDASRMVSADDTAQSRITTFLKSQAGIRSLTPRDGDDPDAVLSRAEAAAIQARLQDAITEISALPEAGQAKLADWVAMATRRAKAAAAANELAANMATN